MTVARGEGWKSYSLADRAGGPSLAVSLSSGEQLDDGSPVVIMFTGDGSKGTKSSSWTNLPPLLGRVGIRSFMVDFEGLGYSEGERSGLTLSKAIKNVARAHSGLTTEILKKDVKIGAIASSFGAAALLMNPAVANKLTAIALKSPAPFLPEAYLKEIGIGEFRKWVTDGHSAINGYSSEVLRDSFRHNVYQSASQISSPCLITHGTADEIVPYTQSELLVACLGGSARLEPMPDGDHGYSKNGQWDQMASVFVQWLSGLLRQ